MKSFLKSKKAMFLGALAIFTLGNVSGVSASSTLKEITAYLDGSMRIVVNGFPFTAKDSDGKVLTPINYEGNTYLPLRSVAEATGLKVAWDDATRTATLGVLNQESEIHTEISADNTFELTLPGPWIRSDNNIKKYNPQIGFGAVNTKLDAPLFIGVMSEPKSAYSDSLTLIEYKELIIDQMQEIDSVSNFSIVSEIDKTINGSTAKQVEINSVINSSVRAGYLITFIETKDRFYQVISWTSTKQMDISKDELAKIASSFKEHSK